jgi:Arc/MetJ-type ribon-helix-helix transcriptional regulator
MKLSISLPQKDVEALDRYAKSAGVPSRSAAIQRAIHLLGDSELEEAYATAWEEWEASGDAAAWDQTAGDGVADAPR